MTGDPDAHVRRLWRHRGTTVPVPRRGPRQQLNLDEILDAAIALADAEGLAAVSTRAVAAHFDRTAMALYPYVGSKEHLLALMQDHACVMPMWTDPTTGLADGLGAWALALFEVYLAHPWLTQRPWSQASQGPNEQDWLERLLQILQSHGVPAARRSAAVTMVYATVRACAETASAYRQIDARAEAQWLSQAEETTRQLPDWCDRYPLSAALEAPASDWREAPRAGLVGAVSLLARALEREA